MATKSNGTVAGGNDELTAQQDVALKGAAEDQKAAEEGAKTDEKLAKAHNDQTAGDEALVQDAAVGVDGKNAVSFYNPAPKAVRNRDMSKEVGGYTEAADDKK